MIVLITPTGNRQAQFNLCAHFMRRQTYAGDVTWVIVDDCQPLTTEGVGVGFKDNWTIIKVHPTPIWQGQNTQTRNLSAGIDAMLEYHKESEIEAIFMIEDDDYYRPQYLQRMMDQLKGFKVAGEINTIYYNVHYRNHFTNRNTSHVSLFQLAFKPEMIPIFKSCYNERFIDYKFFEKLNAQGLMGGVNLFNESNLAIGIKGMPGRAGIGAGHGRLMNMTPDPALIYLKSQIGEDAHLYEGYCNNINATSHQLFARR